MTHLRIMKRRCLYTKLYSVVQARTQVGADGPQLPTNRNRNQTSNVRITFLTLSRLRAAIVTVEKQ